MGSVALLAVSKMQPVEKIRAAAQAGLLRMGENYLQEAVKKMASLQDLPIEWHFIGHIQSNKTRGIASHFSWVHSVSNARIAKRLSEQRPAFLPPLNICLQVNLHPENGRAGVSAKDLPTLAALCAELPRLHLRGIMALPVLTENPKVQHDIFRELHGCYKSLQAEGYPLDTFSAGTSHDFEIAIAEGATLVRVGTILFGPRT